MLDLELLIITDRLAGSWFYFELLPVFVASLRYSHSN